MKHAISSRTVVLALCFALCATAVCAAEKAADKISDADAPVNPVKRGQPMKPPRALLQRMFPQDPLYLSLSGGWGYEQADPVVITTPKELAEQYFDTEPLEFALVDFRNFEEFVGSRPESQKMVVMGVERTGRRLVRENGKVLSCITAYARTIPQADFMQLSSDVEGIDPKDTEARKALESRVARVPRTYWFDLTEPYAHNAEMEKKGIKPPADLRR